MVLSSMGNPNCKKYISSIDTKMPEKLKYKKKKQKEYMDTVKPSRSAKKEKSPNQTGEIELDTGKVDIGYDEKKKDAVVSFTQNDQNETGKRVIENSAFRQRVYDGDQVRSNDKYFYGGAMDVRCNVNKPQMMFRRQIDKVSKDNGYATTADKVVPFHQIKVEQKKVEELRALKSNNKDDRVNIHNAISAIGTTESKKIQRNLDFVQKFTQALKDAKENAKQEHAQKDDYLFNLRKKLMIQELSSRGISLEEKKEEELENMEESMEEKKTAEEEKIEEQVKEE